MSNESAIRNPQSAISGDLPIHIDTIIHCEVCKITEDYYANGTAEELLARHIGNAITFEDVAIDYFKNHGWTREVNGGWHCPDHTGQQMRSAE